MAEIKLSELRPAGSELLQDSESFLNELSDRELENVVGGDGNYSVVVRVLSVEPSSVIVHPITEPPVASVILQ